MTEKEFEEKLHDVYKDEEMIDVKMRVKDYKVMMSIIEREHSMHLVWKYASTIAGGVVTFYALIKTGVFAKLGL